MFPIALLTLSLAQAQTADAVEESKPVRAVDARDGLLAPAAALPSAGTLRLAGSGGSTGYAQTQLLFAMLPRVALGAAAMLEDRRFAPAASVRVHVIKQDELGFNMTVAGSASAFSMMEGAGSQGELRTTIGRTAGPFLGVMSSAVAQGFGGRRDTDFESAALATFALTRELRIGAEGRYRTELVDRDIPNHGREFEALGGASAYVTAGAFQVHGLAGAIAPRGLARPGPLFMLGAMIDF